MKSAITLCQVPEAAAGPFVFHQALAEGFADAKRHGYDAVELFFPGPDFISVEEVEALAAKHGLEIAAVGTGAGMVKHGLSLTDPDPAKREAALEFIVKMIELGGQLGAPAILGSMQGKWGGEVSREQALGWLADALKIAGQAAAKYDVSFIYEPLNRYETNLINELTEGARYIEKHQLENIVLLADLFHMNIEESDVAEAIQAAGKHV
ncbi:MAG: sugar phosphate isomerase/epimerase family protein, partial [Akkermansiaceae bacterium]